MSNRVLTAVWSHSESTGTARLVLLALADEANDLGEVATYRRSQSWLMSKTKASERAVRDGIKRLVELGELEVLAPGGGRDRTNYRVLVRGVLKDEPAAESAGTQRRERQILPRRAADSAPPSPPGVPEGCSPSNPTTVDADASTLPGIDAPVDPDALARKLDRQAVCEEWARVDSILAGREQNGQATLVERVAVRSLLRKVIEKGHPWERAEAAMIACSAMTLPSIEVALNGSGSKPRRTESRGQSRASGAWDGVQSGLQAPAPRARPGT